MSVLIFILWAMAAYLLIDAFASVGSALLKALLALFFSLSVVSTVFVFSLFLHLPFFVFFCIMALLPLAYISFNISKRLKTGSFTFPKFNPDRSTVIILACLLLFSSVFLNLSKRWGAWDSWAIWSLHARFLADGANFTNLFTNSISWTHPDYPLMLPSIIALLWHGREAGPVVPLLVALLCGICIPLLLFASLAEKKLNTTGLLVFGLLTLTTILFPYVNSQYADSLLAIFILLPFVLLNQREGSSAFSLTFLTGFFSASCGLIKNEGLPFFLLFALFFLFSHFKNFKQLLWFGCGAALPLLLIAVFKLRYAPAGDLFVNQADSTLAKLGDGRRYSVISEYFVTAITDAQIYFGIVLVFALFMVPAYFRSTAAKIILLMLVVFFVIYLITPNDLAWHLSTSFDRLLHQLFPALLYTVAISYHKKTNNLVQLN